MTPREISLRIDTPGLKLEDVKQPLEKVCPIVPAGLPHERIETALEHVTEAMEQLNLAAKEVRYGTAHTD